MADLINNLLLGMSIALDPTNLLFCFLGALLGTLVGVLPGIGPVATLAVLLPITFYLEPVTGLVMLAGIYYGSQYGGSTTSILLNLPGEASSVVTCIDGHQMAKQGRAGAALMIAALGSLFAGIVATFIIMYFSPSLVSIAQRFQPADYCALMVFGLLASVVLSSGSIIKAVGMVLIGLFLGLVGTDVNSGAMRYTLGFSHLVEGIDFVAATMGIFGIGEIIRNLEQGPENRQIGAKVERLWMTRDDVRRSWPAVLRGTALGSFLGVLPGGGALLSSFAAYALEKKISRRSEAFGHGAIEGVAAPESANNAGAQTSFIPLLTLGIPSNAVMAMMAGALMIHGIAPGPDVLRNQPELYWGLIASMFVGNVMLVIINLPLIGIWVNLLKLPYRQLYIAIVMLCCVGAFIISNSTFNIMVMCVFGVFGYILLKLDCPPAPFALAFIIGPLFEEYLGRALLLSRGNWSTFVTKPISATFLVLSVALLLLILLPTLRKNREAAFVDD